MRLILTWILSIKIACLRLDVSVHECLDIWRNRPAIVILLEEHDRSRQALVGRINHMYPF